MVAVVGAGVAGDFGLVAAQQLVDGRVVELAGQVPQGVVDGRETDAGDLAQGAAHVRVDAFALEGAAADQVVFEAGRVENSAALPPAIFAGDALVGEDADDVAAAVTRTAGLVDQVEAVVVLAHVGERVLVLMDFDAGDDGVWHEILLWGWPVVGLTRCETERLYELFARRQDEFYHLAAIVTNVGRHALRRRAGF